MWSLQIIEYSLDWPYVKTVTALFSNVLMYSAHDLFLLIPVSLQVVDYSYFPVPLVRALELLITLFSLIKQNCHIFFVFDNMGVVAIKSHLLCIYNLEAPLLKVLEMTSRTGHYPACYNLNPNVAPNEWVIVVKGSCKFLHRYSCRIQRIIIFTVNIG